LVVDDDPEWAEGIRDLLGSAGYEVSVAADGRAGLEQARKLRPLIVVTDVEMPLMSGLELLQSLHAEDPRIPVVVATSNVATAESAQQQGAFGVVAKTAPLEEMLGVVGKAAGCCKARLRWRDRRLVRRLRVMRLAAPLPAICLGVALISSLAVLRRVIIG